MTRAVSIRGFTVVLLVGAMAVLPATVSQATSKPLGLRLISVLRHVDVTRFQGQPDLFFPSGTYIAPTDGAFEIDVSVASDGTATLWQVRRDHNGAHRIRRITAPMPVTVADGLPDFFHVSLEDLSGNVVSSQDMPFCPAGGFGLARVDPSGPDRSAYPFLCGSSLTKATVWGVDKGWAAPLFLDVPAPTSPDGDYTLTVGITHAYTKQLHIPARLSTASIGVTITTQTGGPCPPKIVCAASSSARARPGERPRGIEAAESSGSKGVGGQGGLPDMAALPAHDLFIEHNSGDGHDYLDFGATIWNAGSGPLVVEGFRQTDTPLMTATQFIYKDGKPVRSAVIGQFEFDTRPGHDHWHMEDVAQYDLLNAAGSRVVLSEKQSFCLAPTDPVDLLLRGADWQPDRAGLWSSCAGADSIWLREVLPAGWGDTYIQSIAGQSFDITTVPNGRYLVRVTTNPFHRILESSFDNNTSLVAADLGGTPGARTVSLA